MSLLGFDAIGRLALGQVGVSGSNVLVGDAGSYLIGGNAAIFSLREATVLAGYVVAANAAVFIPRLNGSAGSYYEGGAAGRFFIGGASSGTNYVFSGNSVKTAMAFGTVVGNYIVAYSRVAGAIALNVGAVAYQVTGGTAALGRDYVNWWPVLSVAHNWAGESTPSPEWTASAAISPTWTTDVAAVSAWTPRAARPGKWTANPEHADPDPVLH